MKYRIICGLTSYTTKHHIIRAALEAICFQTRDVLEAMKKDLDSNLSKLHADGELTANSILMQLQADLSGVLVCKYNIILKVLINILMLFVHKVNITGMI